MPGKVFSSSSYSEEESSSSSSCKRGWLNEKGPMSGYDDKTIKSKHQSSSSSSSSFPSADRRNSRRQPSQSPVSGYNCEYRSSYKENEEKKRSKRRRSDRCSSSSSPEPSNKRQCSNNYSSAGSRSPNPKNSMLSSYSSYSSHSSCKRRIECNSYSTSCDKVHSVTSRSLTSYEEESLFSSNCSESRYNRTSSRHTNSRAQSSKRKFSMNSSSSESSRDRRRSSVTSSSSRSSHTRGKPASSRSGETYNKRGSSPVGKQRRRPSSSSSMSIASDYQNQTSLECQCKQDLGLNSQESRYGSTYGYSFSPVENCRFERSKSHQTPRSSTQYFTTVPSSPSYETWATQFVARSKTYRHNFIDSHCHIDFLYNRMGVPFNTPYSEFMRSHAHSYPDNYEGCVAVFCNPRTFNLHRPQDTILNMVSRESGVWLALGCHPKSATEFGVSHEQGLRKMLSHPKVVALGEIGLDYSGRFGLHAEVQRRVLITQLKLSLELDLPLVIHCRDADDDCLDIMKQYVPRHHKIHLHCFSRDPTTAQRWIDAFPNLYLGFTPVLTYSSAWEPALSCQLVPLNRLLLETDAPYFVPGQIKKASVKFSHPGFALFTAEKIAELRGISVDTVLKACRENTRKMYGI